MPNGPANQATTTGGWDTVSAITYADLNNHIRTDKHYDTLPFSDTVKSSLGDVYSVSGSFGPWQLHPGGGGQEVRMAVPVTSGKFLLTRGGKKYPADLKGAVVLFDVPLTIADVGTQSHLNVDAGSSGISAVSVKIPGSVDSEIVDLARSAFGNWAKAHLPQFQKPLATIELSDRISKTHANLGWLTPTARAFAAAPATPNHGLPHKQRQADFEKNSILAVMTMTENRVPPKAISVNGTLIPEGSNTGFLIDGSRYMQKMLKPHISALFSGAKVTDFDVFDNGYGIQNNKELSVVGLKLPNGKIVHPTVDPAGFYVTLNGKFLIMDFSGFHFKATFLKADVTLQYSASSTVSLGNTGIPVMTLHAGKGVPSFSMPKWVDWVTLGLSIVAFIAAIFGGALTIVKVLGKGLTATATAAETTVEAAVDVSATIATDAAQAAADAAADDAELMEAANAMDAVVNGAKYTPGIAGWFQKNFKSLSIITAIIGLPSAGFGITTGITKLVGGAMYKPDALRGMMEAASSPVQWPNSGALKLKSIELNNGLFFGGELTFNHPATTSKLTAKESTSE